MRTARVNVYLPDELAEAAHAAQLNISSLTQAAIRRELRQTEVQEWVGRIRRLPRAHVDHAAVLEAVTAAREELGALRG